MNKKKLYKGFGLIAVVITAFQYVFAFWSGIENGLLSVTFGIFYAANLMTMVVAIIALYQIKTDQPENDRS